MKVKISEIFKSIQGEGRYAGYPMLFIRLSGCTRNCSFCDTKYHKDGEEMTITEVVNIISKSKAQIVCFTGGEPLMQYEALDKIIERDRNSNREYHVETNGDLLKDVEYPCFVFDYLAISPKDVEISSLTKKIMKDYSLDSYDIKIVTDLKKTGVEMIKDATILMPLTTSNKKETKEIAQNVWKYCTDNNIRYSPRIHVDLFGNQKLI